MEQRKCYFRDNRAYAQKKLELSVKSVSNIAKQYSLIKTLSNYLCDESHRTRFIKNLF